MQNIKDVEKNVASYPNLWEPSPGRQKMALRCFVWVENNCLVRRFAGQNENHRAWM
jgi:hypothetical protein